MGPSLFSERQDGFYRQFLCWIGGIIVGLWFFVDCRTTAKTRHNGKKQQQSRVLIQNAVEDEIILLLLTGTIPHVAIAQILDFTTKHHLEKTNKNTVSRITQYQVYWKTILPLIFTTVLKTTKYANLTAQN